MGKWHIPGREVGGSFNVLHEGSTIGDHGDAATARACEALLRNRSAGGDPFLLVAGLMNPHDICEWINVQMHWTNLNVTAPEQFPYPQIESQLAPLPDNFTFDRREPEFFVARVRRPQEHYTAAWCQRMWQFYAWSYYRQVEMVDAAIGRILDALENSPHADNTLVMFTSDHGDSMGCHRLIHKISLYDAAVRVPMIVAWPGHVAENRTDRTHLVSGFDVTPTLCDYAGTAPPPDMRGRSLRELIEGRGPAWRDYVVAHSFVVGRMVRRRVTSTSPTGATRPISFSTWPATRARPAIWLRTRPLRARWPSIVACWPSGSCASSRWPSRPAAGSSKSSKSAQKEGQAG